MDNETIDKLWNQAMPPSGEAEQRTRYRFAKLVAAHERNKLAAWMIQFGFATGHHGDTMEELVMLMGMEIVDRIDGEVKAEREACAKFCETHQVWVGGGKRGFTEWGHEEFVTGGRHQGMDYAAAIRARGTP